MNQLNPNGYRKASSRKSQDVKRALNSVLKDFEYFQASKRLQERNVRGQRLPARNRVSRPLPAPPIVTGPRRDLTSRGKEGSDQLSSAASAYSRGYSSQKPQYNLTNDGIRIRKRELLGSLSGSSAFTVANTFALNPGVIPSFPWLSTQAAGWEQYKFHKLKYVYYTRTGSATPGSVMLIPDYDASDPAPGSEIQAMDYKDAKEEVPWVVEFCCDLNPAAMHPGGARKFIRQNNVANTDIKTYDAGNMFIATTDGSNVNWGKLFVEYDVEFFCSQLPLINFQYALFSGTSNSAPPAISTGSNLQMSVSSTGTTSLVDTFTFNQVFQGLCSLDITGVGLASPTSGGGTATCQVIDSVVDGADDNVVAIWKISATPGQTFILDTTNTTITGRTYDFTFRPYSNA